MRGPVAFCIKLLSSERTHRDIEGPVPAGALASRYRVLLL